MTLLCSSPIWIDGHVSDCVINNYLGKVVPLVTCLVSITIHNIGHLFPFISRTMSRNPNILERRTFYPDPKSSTTISPRISQLEIAAIIADINISVFLLVGIEDTADHLEVFISALYSTYLLFLALVRKTLQDTNTSHELQRHSIVLYAIQLVCLAVINHALAIQKLGLFILTASLLRFVIFTVLCLCHWTAPRSTTPRIIKEDDWSPSDTSKQDRASTISRLTFSWLNGLVWKSFRATLEISDLYQLSHNHKSGIIIPRFQVKTPVTLSLLRRLYRVVKYDMLQQGGWAALNSLFVLLPPRLDQGHSPTSRISRDHFEKYSVALRWWYPGGRCCFYHFWQSM